MDTTTPSPTPSPFTNAFVANADELYAQIYISIPIGLALIILYCIIRYFCLNQCEVKRNESPYILPDIEESANKNNIKYPQISHGTFTWIKDIWTLNLNQFYFTAGFDALVFVLFLQNCTYICLLSLPYALLILLPVYATSEGKDASTDWCDRISLNTVGIQSHRLYATLIGQYLFSFIALYYLSNIYLKIAHLTDHYFIDSTHIKNIGTLSWFNYSQPINPYQSNLLVVNDNKSDVGLKQQIHEVEEKHINDVTVSLPPIDRYTVMLRNLPPHLRDQVAFERFMKQLFADKIVKCVLVPDVTELDKVYTQIQYHTNKLQKLSEKHNLNFEDKDKAPTKIYGKTKCFGFCGNNVDLIQYHETEKAELISTFNRLRNSKLKATPTAFVIFKSLKDVTSFISSPKCLDLLMVHVSRAPAAKDLYWPNLSFSDSDLIGSNLCIIGLMTLLLIFWSIPVIAIQGLANIDVIVDAFGGNIHAHLSTSTISWMQGFLTVLVLDIWLSSVPIISDLLSRVQKPGDRGTHEMLILKKYYLCLIFMVLLVTVITSSILNGASDYEDYFKNFTSNIGNIADLLATGLSNMSVYFLLYILLNTFIWLPLELFRPSYYIGMKLGLTEPNRFQYSVWAPKTMLIFSILLTYSVMNPIMWIFGLFFFVLATFVFKYHLSMSWISEFEIGPKQWIAMYDLIRYTFIISNVTLYGFILLKQSYVCSVLLIPLLIFIWIFTGNMKLKFHKIFNSSSLISAQRKDAQMQHLNLKIDEKEANDVYLPPVMSIKYKQDEQPYYQQPYY